jgi:hypothetical protein
MARCDAVTLIIVCLTWPNLAFHICQDVPGHHVRASRRWIKVDANPLHDSWKCFAKLSETETSGYLPQSTSSFAETNANNEVPENRSESRRASREKSPSPCWGILIWYNLHL